MDIGAEVPMRAGGVEAGTGCDGRAVYGQHRATAAIVVRISVEPTAMQRLRWVRRRNIQRL